MALSVGSSVEAGMSGTGSTTLALTVSSGDTVAVWGGVYTVGSLNLPAVSDDVVGSYGSAVASYDIGSTGSDGWYHFVYRYFNHTGGSVTITFNPDSSEAYADIAAIAIAPSAGTIEVAGNQSADITASPFTLTLTAASAAFLTVGTTYINATTLPDWVCTSSGAVEVRDNVTVNAEAANLSYRIETSANPSMTWAASVSGIDTAVSAGLSLAFREVVAASGAKTLATLGVG